MTVLTIMAVLLLALIIPSWIYHGRRDAFYWRPTDAEVLAFILCIIFLVARLIEWGIA